MNNATINSLIKYFIIIGLVMVPFIPTYVDNSLFFPFITGKGFAFRIIVEIVFALWLILVFREKGTSVVGTDKSVLPRCNAVSVSIAVFTVIALIVDLAGLNPLRSIWSNFERMEGWLMIVHLWAYFTVLSSVLKTKESWHKFFNVVIVSGLITALYGLAQFFGWAETHQGGRVDASLGNSAYMAVYMLFNVFISGYLAASYFAKKNLFYSYFVASVFFSFIMFQTATRGTIIGWTVAIIISCLIYSIFGRKATGQSNRSRIVSGSAVLFILIVGVLFYFNRNANWIQKNEVLGRLASISISDTKTQARRFIWPMAIKGVVESPKTTILGVGQENFNYIFNSNYNPQMWKHEQWFDRAHSVFLDWFVAGGILGLLSYLSLYIISLIFIIKSDKTVGEKSILIGLLVGYGIHNVFVFDNQTSYVMFFTLLAFVHSLKKNKELSIFKNYSKAISEDAETVRDYIYVPVTVILFIATIYFINIRVIQSNTNLIKALIACSNPQTVSIVPFEKIFKLGQTVANQETVEQLLNCSSNVIQNPQIQQDKKAAFYDLAKKEIDNQIKKTPNDARIYIIGGSYYDTIRDFNSATPLLEKANELSPNKQSIIFELAVNYLNIGKNKEAVAILDKAYQSATDNPISKTTYVTALITAGEEAKAKELFGDDMEVFSDPRVINAYILSNKYDKAIAIYKQLLTKDPDNQEVYSSLAYVYLLNKQDYQAIELLKKAKERFPLIKAQVEDAIKQIESGKFKTP
jgi:tetratricopeptide (TPR) repeat protein/O-antigen ligase